MKVVWVPPEYGDAVACIFSDGGFSIWEEVAEGIYIEVSYISVFIVEFWRFGRTGGLVV